MTPNFKLWRHICWRHSYVNFKLLNGSQIFISFLKELFKGSWNLKKFFQYLKYELRYDILNLDKFGAQKRGTPFYWIILNFRVLLACVASVSVRLRSKEWGSRVKDRAKNDASQNRKSSFALKPNWNACYAGYSFIVESPLLFKLHQKLIRGWNV